MFEHDLIVVSSNDTIHDECALPYYVINGVIHFNENWVGNIQASDIFDGDIIIESELILVNGREVPRKSGGSI